LELGFADAFENSLPEKDTSWWDYCWSLPNPGLAGLIITNLTPGPLQAGKALGDSLIFPESSQNRATMRQWLWSFRF